MNIRRKARLDSLGILNPSENLEAPRTARSDLAATTFYSSPSYNKAINTSRFVKGFGITALVCSILSLFIGANFLLAGAIGLGIGLFILRYDEAAFYRAFGIVVMVLAIIGGLFPFLNPAIVSSAALWKGIEVLRVLSKEGHEDRGWKACRTRTIIGIAAGCTGLVVAFISMVVVLIKFVRILLATQA